jgi:hypothetical protein
MPPTRVHFNGSVNLSDAETVMREISSRIPTGVRRMTDGETGERGYWIHFQIEKFLAMPEFESVSVGKAYDTGDADAPDMPRLRLADGVSPEDVNWPNLGYADAYSESFFRAWTVCPRTCPSGSTSATATTATSISSSRTRSRCSSGS